MKKNKQKKKRLTALLAAGILSVSMMTAPLAVHAYVVDTETLYHFNMNLEYYYYGYNSTPQDKHSGYPLFWLIYEYCSNGPNYPVNYLVIASDDAQISHSVIVNSTNQTGHAEYYAANHVGSVRLRANTGDYRDGYRIMGQWAPDAFYIGQ